MLRDALADPWAREPPRPIRGLPGSRFWRNVLFNLAVGGFTLAVLQAVPEWPWLAAKEEQALDWVVRMQAGVAPERYAGAPFVLLELDERTYRGWDEPLLVPRDRLHALIEFAVRGEAALVLVDVDLSRRTPDDAALARYLRGFVRDGPRSGTQIVLARTFREPHPPGTSPWREQRPSFLDETVAGAPDLHWASTLFLQDRDLRIRRFRNAEPTCNDGTPDVMPAAQLLALALLRDPTGGPEALAEALAVQRPDCSLTQPPETAPPDRLARLGDVEVALVGNRVSNRILYAFGWSDSGDAPNPSVSFDGRTLPLFTRLPARLVTDTDQPPDPGLLAGRIVVIGASYAESRDVHRTPLGWMPGAVILQNAIYSLLQNGGLKPPSTATVLSIQLGLLVAAALIFASLGSYWAVLIAAPVSLLALLPFSFWMFRSGMWLDLAIPIGAIQAVAVARRYQERYSHFRIHWTRVRQLAAELEEEAWKPDSPEEAREREASSQR
ncbi:MAG: CHASE2 domain-containing protein [Myxococcota bacterium]